jgi:pyruvate dehydrogenase E1 component
MRNTAPKDAAEIEALETREWLESLDYVLQSGGPVRVSRLLRELSDHARRHGVSQPFTANTPYINSIPPQDQPPFPGSREIERRIKSLVRWNALAMVVKANKAEDGIGGHISTFASAATLYEVGFNHFFKGKGEDHDGDIIYFQGHAAPGIYARAFLEGRLSGEKLENFRRELKAGGGLSSYPHPWLMPDFWEFPTVSMGLGPIMSIYQARFMRYLEDRGLKKRSNSKVWAFLGDGETDEPETLGAITLGSREKLDNLIFVINCNLQRLDGPVRGNGQIIQELEAIFRGAGWNVIKVIWGTEWDGLLEKDHDGALVKRMGEVVDGEYQKYAVESGEYVRKHFWGADPRLLDMVKHLSDEQLKKLTLGGHDPIKVYSAYNAAVQHTGQPTVILARTIKGYGIGEAGEGKNITHQQKKMNEDELKAFRTRFGIPIGDEEVAKAPFYRPPDNSPEVSYMLERRKQLGGFVPSRKVQVEPLKTDSLTELFAEFKQGSEGRKASTTMAFVRMLAKMLRDKRSANWSCRSFPTKRGHSVWRRCFGRSASTRMRVSSMSRSTWTRCCTTRKPKKGRFSKKALPRPDRFRHSLPRAARTPRTASIPSPSSSITRCSVCSASATWCGPRPTRARVDSCSEAPPAAPRSPAKACSIRTATAICCRWRCPI